MLGPVLSVGIQASKFITTWPPSKTALKPENPQDPSLTCTRSSPDLTTNPRTLQPESLSSVFTLLAAAVAIDVPSQSASPSQMSPRTLIPQQSIPANANQTQVKSIGPALPVQLMTIARRRRPGWRRRESLRPFSPLQSVLSPPSPPAIRPVPGLHADRNPTSAILRPCPFSGLIAP